MTSLHPVYFGTDLDVWKRASSSGKFGTQPAGSRDKAPAENPVGGKQKLHVKKTCATPFFRKSHLENLCEIEAVSVGSFCREVFLSRRRSSSGRDGQLVRYRTRPYWDAGVVSAVPVQYSAGLHLAFHLHLRVPKLPSRKLS